MDQRPTAVETNEPPDIGQHVCEEVRRLAGVVDAAVRLREEGHVFSGKLFVVLREQSTNSNTVAQRVAAIAEGATALDWRLHNLVVMPVERIDIA